MVFGKGGRGLRRWWNGGHLGAGAHLCVVELRLRPSDVGRAMVLPLVRFPVVGVNWTFRRAKNSPRCQMYFFFLLLGLQIRLSFLFFFHQPFTGHSIHWSTQAVPVCVTEKHRGVRDGGSSADAPFHCTCRGGDEMYTLFFLLIKIVKTAAGN